MEVYRCPSISEHLSLDRGEIRCHRPDDHDGDHEGVFVGMAKRTAIITWEESRISVSDDSKDRWQLLPASA